jgi:hypothetical protein
MTLAGLPGMGICSSHSDIDTRVADTDFQLTELRCRWLLDEFLEELSHLFGPFCAGKRSAYVGPIYCRVGGYVRFNVLVTNDDNLGPMYATQSVDHFRDAL